MKAKSNRFQTVLRALSGALICAAWLGIAASTVARAADDESADLRPPEVSNDSEAGETQRGEKQSRRIEAPEVSEREEYGQTITEYRRRGGVYLMTVKPRVGPTQYWNDPDGDGQFQRSTSDNIDENLNLPKWRLGSW